MGMKYFETSAFTGYGVKEVINYLVSKIFIVKTYQKEPEYVKQILSGDIPFGIKEDCVEEYVDQEELDQLR